MMMGPRKCRVIWRQIPVVKYCCVVGLSFLLSLHLGLETQCSGPLCSCALLCRRRSQAREQRRVRSRLAVGRSFREAE